MVVSQNNNVFGKEKRSDTNVNTRAGYGLFEFSELVYLFILVVAIRERLWWAGDAFR